MKYIGVKIVDAEPMCAASAHTLGYKTNGGEQGYEVTYPDGYKSWCPRDMFESVNRPVNAMPFGSAIEALKQGKKVARAGWNGKGMYLWLLPSATVKAEWCREPHLKMIAEANRGEIECLGSIRMFTADKKVLTGWLASQTDMLADDWHIVWNLA